MGCSSSSATETSEILVNGYDISKTKPLCSEDRLLPLRTKHHVMGGFEDKHHILKIS
jgi:hypothetical protein